MKFTFIDLFAGIGGTRIGFEKAGGKCIFSSEYDKYCQITYKENFGEIPYGDITLKDNYTVPDHDILVAGFPCQPFSIAGVSKKKSLGEKHGFEEKKQGNLFFYIRDILQDKKPKAFLLENVKNLRNHDKGNTYRVITETLVSSGYKIFDRVLDGSFYTPQHRERIFIAGFRKDLYPDIDFKFPENPEPQIRLKDILEKSPDRKYTISDHLWKYLRDYAEKHRLKGNGFGYGLINPDVSQITRTLSARYYKDGSEILISQNGYNPRRLTPRECARLMGFPDSFRIPVSDTQAYKQFGNSVVVPLIEAIAKKIIKTIRDYDRQNISGKTKLEHVKNPVKEYKTGNKGKKISVR